MYHDQEHHTFDQEASHALIPYEPPAAGSPHFQKRHPFLLRGAALALCCCLLGGGAGAGAVWSMSGGGPLAGPRGTAVTPVVLNSTTSGKAMSNAEIYAAAVNSVVSINTTISQAGINIFGQPVQAGQGVHHHRHAVLQRRGLGPEHQVLGHQQRIGVHHRQQRRDDQDVAEAELRPQAVPDPLPIP